MDPIGNPIPVRDIVWLFRRRHGIDVERFFLHTHTTLRCVRPHFYYQFDSVLPGDAAFYAELMGRRGYASQDKAEFVKAAECVKEDSRVLDIGCGVGKFAKYCSGQYKGIDLNPQAVEEARTKGLNVTSEPLQAQKNAAFDIVCLFQVLEHVQDPEALLSEAARCVAPSGLLIVSTPDMDGTVGHAVNQELNYPPHHMTWWSDKSLASILKSKGFDVKDIWKEPLQRTHFSPLIFSLLHPRRELHIDLSWRARISKIVAAILRRFVGLRHDTIPFIQGHTVMVTAIKRG